MLAALLAAALPAGVTPAARAEDACVPDARRFCPDVPYGGGAVLDCLRERWYQLSSACQQRIQQADDRARQLDVSCANDVFRHCPTVPRGKMRVVSCLGQHWNDLSSTCRDAVSRVAEKLQTFTDACSGDAARLCAGIEPGQGRIFACLKFQERAVSSRCAAALRP